MNPNCHYRLSIFQQAKYKHYQLFLARYLPSVTKHNLTAGLSPAKSKLQLFLNAFFIATCQKTQKRHIHALIALNRIRVAKSHFQNLQCFQQSSSFILHSHPLSSIYHVTYHGCANYTYAPDYVSFSETPSPSTSRGRIPCDCSSQASSFLQEDCSLVYCLPNPNHSYFFNTFLPQSADIYISILLLSSSFFLRLQQLFLFSQSAVKYTILLLYNYYFLLADIFNGRSRSR